jgi:nucleotide-binding universal stress UspA family protein
MYRSILVPLDGSRLSERALPTAIALCKRTVARLHIVHVRRMIGAVGPSTDALRDDGAREYLDAVTDRAADELGESVSFAILPAEEPELLLPSPTPHGVAEYINTYAVANRIDLIVSTTHGRGGLSRAWFGSVTEALLRAADIPLLLIRPEDHEELDLASAAPFDHILVALDGSAESERVLRPARELGAASNAHYTILQIVQTPAPMFEAAVIQTVPMIEEAERLRQQAELDLARPAATLNEAGAHVTIVTQLADSPANAILQYAREHDVDAIALTTHARRALRRMVLGSVADKVIRGAECPTLVVRRSIADVGQEPQRWYSSARPQASAGRSPQPVKRD